jgi:hypothetical protein
MSLLLSFLPLSPPMLIRQPVDPTTYGFRLSVARAQPQYPGAGGGQGNSVADGYENGFRPVSRAQNGGDRFTLVRQRRTVSLAVPWAIRTGR